MLSYLTKTMLVNSILRHPNNGEIFIIGGVDDSRKATGSIEVGERDYNGNWIWYSRKEFLHSRVCGSTCIAGGYIYIFGGYVKSNPHDYPHIDQGTMLPVLKIERLNLENNKKETITTFSLLITNHCL